MKMTRVLFFIAGPVATADEAAKASALESASAVVLFRNASACGDGDAVEVADGYAGLVPAVYRGRAPIVDEALPELPAAPAPVAPVAASPAPAAPVVATVTPPAPPSPDADEAAKQRAAIDEGAKSATAAQLKEALKDLGIKHASNASKAELLALFLNR